MLKEKRVLPFNTPVYSLALKKVNVNSKGNFKFKVLSLSSVFENVPIFLT